MEGGGGGTRGETQRPNHWWSLHTTNQGVDSHESLAPRREQPGVKSSNGEPLSSPESKRATTQHIHPRTTPTNTGDRSVCRFGDMCKSAWCPLHHPTASGTTQQPQWDAGSDMLPPWRRRPEAVSRPAEKERARNWEERMQQNSWAQGRPTHGRETGDMGTQERHQTGGGATQTHRTREPHQEGQGRAQQTRRRSTARRERQVEQREQRTRMERMAERAHGRQRQ